MRKKNDKAQAIKKKQDISPSPIPSSAKRRTVTFECVDTFARHVSVVGTFNDWDEAADPMRGEAGRFVKTKRLPPGEYEYKLVADGKWYEDPTATKQVENGLGTRNSVIRV